MFPTISLVSLCVYVRLEPYRSSLCQRVQVAALLQLVFTYMAASAYYVDPQLIGSSNEYPEPTSNATGVGAPAESRVTFELFLTREWNPFSRGGVFWPIRGISKIRIWSIS